MLYLVSKSVQKPQRKNDNLLDYLLAEVCTGCRYTKV